MSTPNPSSHPDDPTVRLQPKDRGVADLMRGLLTEDDADSESPVSSDDPTVKFTSRPAPVQPARLPGAVEPGARIGNYVLKEKLGQGGFGTVWRAEQVAPFKRDVALKIVLHGMDTEEVIARFEAEKKLLAKMDHPNIASVYDAGATESGRPYFVMELVKGPAGPGLPITKFCNEKKLSIRERIELFIPVCQAVQHAHMKQVLHRDLKPTNILVAEVDGVPAPKIIDFGIAKAMSPDDEELLASRLRTAQDMVVGTLQYMSPEQAGAVQDIDTRSDVYTLGVILYEMLVGEPPIGKEEVKKAVFDVLRMIRDATPPRRPSTRWLTATDAQKQTALTTHRADPRRLSQQISGDLDWIVLKALEKDRTRRYSAAMELAEDLSRFLRHEPVSAGPPSAGYRLKKLIKRHKLAFAASAAVLAAIITGGGVALWQWQVATTARDAEAQARQAAEHALTFAEQARALAERREREAEGARELEAKAREQESQARRQAEAQKKLADAARSEAEKERGIAQTARTEAEDLINYMLFDLRDKLEPLNRIALLDDIAQKSEAYFKAQPADSETDSQMRNRGGMWQNRGQIALAMGRTDEAAKAFREFHRIMAARAQQSPADQQRLLDLAIADGRMSLLYEQKGMIADAAASAQAEHDAVKRLCETSRTPSPGQLRHLAATWERLGDLAKAQQKNDQAETSYQEGRRILEALLETAPGDRDTRRAFATIQERLGDVMMAAGNTSAAMQLYAREAGLFSGLLGESDSDSTLRRALAVALQKQASAALAAGDTGTARSLATEALQRMEALSTADPGNRSAARDLALAHQKMAEILVAAGKPDEAMPHWRKDLEISKVLAAADEDSARSRTELAVACWNLAQGLLRQGEKTSITEALELFKRGEAILAELKSKKRLDETGAAWLESFGEAVADTAKIPK